jgi:hypothetical protein
VGIKLEILKNKSYMFIPHLCPLVFTKVVQNNVVQFNRSRRGPVQSGTQAQQGCFAAARRTYNRQRGPALTEKSIPSTTVKGTVAAFIGFAYILHESIIAIPVLLNLLCVLPFNPVKCRGRSQMDLLEQNKTFYEPGHRIFLAILISLFFSFAAEMRRKAGDAGQ